MKNALRLAVGTGAAMCLSALAVGNASAAQLNLETDEGDYFTKRFSVYADDPLTINPSVASQQWTLKKQGRVIRRSHAATWTLAPGTYKATYRATPKMRSTITLGQWDTYCKVSGAESTRLEDGLWHSIGAVRCTDAKLKMSYVGQFDVIGDEDYARPFADSEGLPRNLALQLQGTPRTLLKKFDVTVKAVNGSWISSAESRAVKVGMSKNQVHRIFGTKGRQRMVAPGFEIRFYEGGHIVIGYVNGRVNSIQRM